MLVMNRFKYLFVVGLIIQLLTLFFPCHSSYFCAIAPLLLGTLAAAGGAAMNSIANDQNKRNAQYSMNLQKDLLDYQWEKFDSPKAQLDSYAKAGINPAVALGQGSMRGASPSASAPEVAQVGQSATDTANTILALSQAKKAGSEAAGEDLNNRVKEATLDELIKTPALANKYTQEQTAALTQSIGLMSANFQKIQQDIENAKSEKKLTDEKVKWFAKEMEAKISDLKSSAKYKEAIANLTDSQRDLLDRTMDDLVSITGYQKDYQKAVVDLLGKYGDAQAIVGMISQVAGSAADLIGNFYKPAQVIKKITSSE